MIPKLVLLGPSGCGKTALVTRLVDKKFDVLEDSTIGCIFSRWRHDKDVAVDIWDTAGQERYMSITPIYFRNAQIIIFMFDASDLESIGKMGEFIMLLFNSGHGEGKKFVVIGNKIDNLKCSVDYIETEYKLNDIVQEYDFDLMKPYFISVKTGQGIDMVIDDLVGFVRGLEVIEKEKIKMDNYNRLNCCG